MKIVLIIALSLILLLIAGGVGLGWQSHKAPQLGTKDGQLRPCPKSPNCVCSEDGTASTQLITPLSENDVRLLQTALKRMGGEIIQAEDHYLHATFTSRLFRFVDDLELRIDPDAGIIHLRSASRVGHSDLGVNRKRVETLRRLLRER